MKIDKHQALILLNKIDDLVNEENLKSEGGESAKYSVTPYNKLESVRYKKAKDMQIYIRKREEELFFELQSQLGNISGKYSLPIHIFARFNPVRSAWYKLSKKVLKIHNKNKITDAERKEQDDREQFNKVLHSACPDIMNNIILGISDDK